MSSLPRRLQRRARLKAGEKRDPRQLTRNVTDESYEVCHPTRGWRRFSAKRIWAQHRMATLLGGRT